MKDKPTAREFEDWVNSLKEDSQPFKKEKALRRYSNKELLDELERRKRQSLIDLGLKG